MKMKTAVKSFAVIAVTIVTLVVLYIVGSLVGSRVYGDSGQVYKSKNYQDGTFHNEKVITMRTTDRNMFSATIDFIRGNPNRLPAVTIQAVDVKAIGKTAGDDLRVTWLGHSTSVIEIDGKVILTDPMLSNRASPFSFVGPKRFATSPTVTVQDLPKIDAVVISHDHYDHLDYKTILALHEQVEQFFVPLGVADRLKRWGVSQKKISELDWWEEKSFGPLTFVATPSQHFSGRTLTDRNKTLWASWTIIGTKQRTFFSGDSGYFDGFKRIGEKYGPFDISLLESGAYNEAWSDIHMMPEETVQASIDLQSRLLMPIHWAQFSLSTHPWKEPIERLLKSAEDKTVTVATPRIGETFSPGKSHPETHWWERVVTNNYAQVQ